MKNYKKTHIKTINLKQLKQGMKNWNYLMELYSTSDIQNYFEYISKQHAEKTINPSIRIYVDQIENRIMFKVQTGYYLKLSTPETMKLLGSITSKIMKDENDEYVPYLEITEVVSVHCNIASNNYQ